MGTASAASSVEAHVGLAEPPCFNAPLPMAVWLRGRLCIGILAVTLFACQANSLVASPGTGSPSVSPSGQTGGSPSVTASPALDGLAESRVASGCLKAIRQ